MIVGTASTAKDYITSNYALISQSATAIPTVTVGLPLLAVLVLKIMADRQNESEQDVLSGHANHSGFERRVRSLMSASPEMPHAVIVCDLDHFKSIDDTYGYCVGDLLIQGSRKVLRNYTPAISPSGRIGGEAPVF